MALLKQHHFLTIAHKVALICCCFLFLHAPAFASEERIESIACDWSLSIMTNKGHVWAIPMDSSSKGGNVFAPELFCADAAQLRYTQQNGIAVINSQSQLFGMGNWSTLLPKGSPASCDYNALPQLQYFMDDVLDVATNIDFNLTLKTDGTLWAWHWDSIKNRPVMLTEHPLLRDVLTFDTADNVGVAVVTKDGKLWFWNKDTPITSKPKLLMQKVKDCAISRTESNVLVALDKSGQLHLFGEKFKNNVKIIARNVSKVKGKGLGPVCFTTTDGMLWAISTFTDNAGDATGIAAYGDELEAAHQDILVKKRLHYTPYHQMYVSFIGADVVDFFPGYLAIAVKKTDGMIYGRGLFYGNVPLPQSTPHGEPFQLINVKLDATGLTPRYDLKNLHRTVHFKKLCTNKFSRNHH